MSSGIYGPPSPPLAGGTPLTSGSIPFANASGALTQDNANFKRDPVTGALKIVDASGTEQFTAAKYASQAFGVFRGSSGTPITTAGPLVKYTKYENLDTTAMAGNPADSAVNANIVSISTGSVTNFPQVTAFYGLAQGGGTTAGADACGIAGVGISSNATATGWGMGAYLEGRGATATNRWYGAEISPNNQTGVDAAALVSNACNPGTGIWVPSRGPNLNAVGVAVAALAGTPGFRAGFMVNQSSASEAAFRDDSSATVSYVINGTHTYGIDMAGATISGSAIRLPNNKPIAGRNAANAADLAVLSIGGNNHVQLGSSTVPIDAAGLLLPGKGVTFPNMGANAASDSGLNFLDTLGTTISYVTLQNDNTLHVGPSTTPATNGQVIFYAAGTSPGAAPIEAFRLNPAGGFKHSSAALGFFNTATQAKQAVTGSRGANAALASLITALATYGLVTDSSTV